MERLLQRIRLVKLNLLQDNAQVHNALIVLKFIPQNVVIEINPLTPKSWLRLTFFLSDIKNRDHPKHPFQWENFGGNSKTFSTIKSEM
jgi:hypothetical protein